MPNRLCITSCYMPAHAKWNMLASRPHHKLKRTTKKSEDRKDLNPLWLSSLDQWAISQSTCNYAAVLLVHFRERQKIGTNTGLYVHCTYGIWQKVATAVSRYLIKTERKKKKDIIQTPPNLIMSQRQLRAVSWNKCWSCICSIPICLEIHCCHVSQLWEDVVPWKS